MDLGTERQPALVDATKSAVGFSSPAPKASCHRQLVARGRLVPLPAGDDRGALRPPFFLLKERRKGTACTGLSHTYYCGVLRQLQTAHRRKPGDIRQVLTLGRERRAEPFTGLVRQRCRGGVDWPSMRSSRTREALFLECPQLSADRPVRMRINRGRARDAWAGPAASPHSHGADFSCGRRLGGWPPPELYRERRPANGALSLPGGDEGYFPPIHWRLGGD